MTRFLDVQNVTAGYGSYTVLRDLSLHVNLGENVGLFGPNGHGKTTLMRVLSGLIRPESGQAYFEDNDLGRLSPSKIVARGLIHSQQGNTLFKDMAIAETLTMSAFCKRGQEQAKENMEFVYALFPRLAERKSQLAKTLSGGERQMLSIGAALMCAPRLLLLDEPTLGLSPKLKEELSYALKDISEKVPLIVVEQDVDLLLSLSDRLYFIEHGSVQQEISKDNSPDQKAIMDMYFGNEA